MNKIVVIGPRGIGKSTIAPLVAAQLGIPHVNYDLMLLPLWNSSKQKRAELLTTTAPALLDDILSDETEGIIDLGASSVSSPFAEATSRVRASLKNACVIPLLYAVDLEISVQQLYERELAREHQFESPLYSRSLLDYNRFTQAVKELDWSPVYLEGKTVDQAVQLIIEQVKK